MLEIYYNALIDQSKHKITTDERTRIIKELLETKSYHEISKQTNIPKTTLFNWANERSSNSKNSAMTFPKIEEWIKSLEINGCNKLKLIHLNMLIENKLDE